MEVKKRMLKSQNINTMLPLNNPKEDELSPTTKQHHQQDLVEKFKKNILSFQ